jgi:hypothetical protein
MKTEGQGVSRRGFLRAAGTTGLALANTSRSQVAAWAATHGLLSQE